MAVFKLQKHMCFGSLIPAILQTSYYSDSTVKNISLSAACSVALGGQRTQTSIHYCMQQSANKSGLKMMEYIQIPCPWTNFGTQSTMEKKTGQTTTYILNHLYGLPTFIDNMACADMI